MRIRADDSSWVRRTPRSNAFSGTVGAIPRPEARRYAPSAPLLSRSRNAKSADVLPVCRDAARGGSRAPTAGRSSEPRQTTGRWCLSSAWALSIARLCGEERALMIQGCEATARSSQRCEFRPSVSRRSTSHNAASAGHISTRDTIPVHGGRSSSISVFSRRREPGSARPGSRQTSEADPPATVRRRRQSAGAPHARRVRTRSRVACSGTEFARRAPQAIRSRRAGRGNRRAPSRSGPHAGTGFRRG